MYQNIDYLDHYLAGQQITVGKLSAIGGGGMISIVVIMLFVCVILKRRKSRSGDVKDGGKIIFSAHFKHANILYRS